MKKECVYQRYGNYIINRSQSLGSGTFGNVYKGYQIKTVQKVSFLMRGQTYELEPVAIKQSYYEPHNVQQINTLKILKHPNIIRYIDYKIHGNSIFMVMQLCQQGTLQDFLMTIPQDQNQHQTLLFYYCQIVNAMKFMYEKNILHRDIKPSNILMKDNLIKIADFGTSKLKNQMELKTLVGTPLFSSPQLLQLSLGQQETYTQKSDIWSLGLVLYLMFNYQRNQQKQSQRLKQSLPWIGKNTGEVFKSIKTNPLKMKKQNIPQNIKIIIEKMLKINPKQRMSFSQLFNLKQFQQETYNSLKISLSQSNLAISMSYLPSQADFELTKTKPNVQKKIQLQNSQSCEVQQIDRQTIDWELFKLLEIKDSQSYEDDQIKQALEFYKYLLFQFDEIIHSNPKIKSSELLFQLQRQIFKLSSWRKWNIQTKRLAHMDVNSNNKSDIKVSNNTIAMMEKQNIINLIQNISQKYFERQKQLSVLVDPSKFQKILDNANSDKVQSKDEVIIQFVQPSEKLLQEIKKFIRMHVTQKLFQPFQKQGIKQKSTLSLFQQNYVENKKMVLFIYDLFIAVAFEESWKAKNKLQMDLSNGTKGNEKQVSNMNDKFFERFKKTKNSVKIQQIICRIKAAYSYFKFTELKLQESTN